MARKNDLVGLTKEKIRRRNTRLKIIMHIRDQAKTQIIFMDIDLIINSKFIGSQQTYRKKELHQIDHQESIILRIKRETGSHLATNYGPVGLQICSDPT